MKKNIVIILSLVVAQLFAFYLKSHAQVPPISQSTFLLADETTLTYSKTEAKIVCDNESVFDDIFKTHGTLFKRFTCTWKTDRYGRYKHYIIYCSKEDGKLIESWAKTNL